MTVIMAVLLAYLVIRVVSYWRSSVDVETLASRAVHPMEARRRLGCAESLGIRVVDVTRLADGLSLGVRQTCESAGRFSCSPPSPHSSYTSVGTRGWAP